MARIACGAIAIAVLAALCALVLPRGLADLRGYEARMFFKTWETKRRLPTAEEWIVAHRLLAEARDLDSAQHRFSEDLGRLHELRARPFLTGDPRGVADLRQALDYQRDALRRRPGSPYTWANIALLKTRLLEIDREFQTVLRRAALLGPWEPEVQLVLADASFRYWNALTPEARAAMQGNAARALRWQDAKLLALARRTGRLDVLCALTGVQSPQLSRACN